MSETAHNTIQLIGGIITAILGLNAVSVLIHKRQNEKIKELQDTKINEEVVALMIDNVKLEVREVVRNEIKGVKEEVKNEIKDVLKDYYYKTDQVDKRIDDSVNPVMNKLEEIHKVILNPNANS